MAAYFTLSAELTDGFKFDLPGRYPSQAAADRAASNFIRDYSDPCGLGVRVYCVAVIRHAPDA